MKTKASKLPTLSGQRGFLLLALLLILIITGSTFVLAGLNNRQSSYLQQQTELHKQMEIAKINLLTYAANSGTFFANNRGPGFFPCPDTATTVSVDPNYGHIVNDTAATDCTEILGRLPEYVVNGTQKFYLNNYYAGIDQQFWYAVGDPYTYSADPTKRRSYLRTSPNNIDPTSRFFLDGKAGYVALIIAPGDALDNQDRVSVSGRSSYTNYLEGGNGSTNAYLTQYGNNPSQFNDQVLGITLEEYIRAVGSRVAAVIKLELDAFHIANSTYPDPAPATDFSTKMDGSSITWLDSAGTGNGEHWSNIATIPVDVVYSRISSGVAKIYFSDCANITFTLTFGAGITTPPLGTSCS